MIKQSILFQQPLWEQYTLCPKVSKFEAKRELGQILAELGLARFHVISANGLQVQDFIYKFAIYLKVHQLTNFPIVYTQEHEN